MVINQRTTMKKEIPHETKQKQMENAVIQENEGFFEKRYWPGNIKSDKLSISELTYTLRECLSLTDAGLKRGVVGYTEWIRKYWHGAMISASWVVRNEQSISLSQLWKGRSGNTMELVGRKMHMVLYCFYLLLRTGSTFGWINSALFWRNFKFGLISFCHGLPQSRVREHICTKLAY